MPAQHSFIQELKAFVRFLNSLWGLLAGAVMLFPLSNVLFEFMPLDLARFFDSAGNTAMNPASISTISIVGCLFVTLVDFGRRERLASSFLITTEALVSSALAAMALYFYFSYHDSQFRGDGTSVRVFFESIPLIISFSYIAFFVFMTHAFVLLAVREYMKVNEASDAPG